MWDEREIVLALMAYHSNADLDHNAKYKAIRFGVSRSEFTRYRLQSKYKIAELEMEVTDEHREKWKQTRYLIDECIEDGYVREEETTHKVFNPGIGGQKYKAVSDGHYLHLTSKGKKLARKSYFYLKYLPEEFSDMKIVLITIFGTIVTSPLWLEIKPLLSLLINKLIN